MDGTLIIIAIVIVLIIVAIVVLLSKDKGGETTAAPQKVSEVEKKEAVTHKRFKQVLSGSDLQSDMKAEEEELLTKYSAGTGEGINEVEKLLEGDPNNVDLLDWLAFMYYSNANIDKAIETYKRALDIKPDNENQHYYLGNSYFKKKMMTEARQEWSEVIRLKPNSKIAKNAQERIDYLATQGK